MDEKYDTMEQKTRVERILALIEKRRERINGFGKGKIYIDFAGRRIKIEVSEVEEEN